MANHVNDNENIPFREGTYFDYGHVEEKHLLLHHASSTKNQNFPVILHYVLSELEKDGLEHIMSWQARGRSFIVHDTKQMEKRLLPL